MTHTAKHTPGPWHLEYDVDGIPLTIIGADNSAIGIVETWNAHTEGNRHLLTAAPAMYTQLVYILGRLHAHENGEYTDAQLHSDMERIDKTLAQAEGKHD